MSDSFDNELLQLISTPAQQRWSREEAEAVYDWIEAQPEKRRRSWTRVLGQEDLYFMLTRVCRRTDARFLESTWVFDRCLEVEADPDNRLDLWFRGGYKSSIITQTLTLQDIIKDPEITIGIFSHTRPNAQTFLEQIMREMEENPLLHDTWPEIFWRNPRRDAPLWSRQSGIIVQRKGNPKEATIEAWGVVKGQPTGRHFGLQVYDDLVSREQVSSELMIDKTMAATELSFNLGSRKPRRRFIGTRYHFADPYKKMMDRGMIKPRTYAARDNEGNARYYTDEELEKKRREQGLVTFSSQMMQNPTMDSVMGFREDDLRFYDGKISHHDMNVYITCDPAHSRKKTSDYTAIWVIGLSPDARYVVLDYIKDRLTSTQICKNLIMLHRYYSLGGKSGMVKGVGLEQYGAQAHGDLLRQMQEEQRYRFEFIELGGNLSKPDRIARLQQPFQDHRIWMPRSIFRTNYEKKVVDLVHEFVHLEYLPYPSVSHDDGLDALARILDDKMSVVWPMPNDDSDTLSTHSRGTAWSA